MSAEGLWPRITEGPFLVCKLEVIRRQSQEDIDIRATHDDWTLFCATDLLWSLFNRPELHLMRTVTGFYNVIRQKYGSSVEDCKIFSYIRAHLCAPPDDEKAAGDDDVRLFMVLLMFYYEPELMEVVRKSFRPGNPWGSVDDALQHFNTFVHASLTPLVNALHTKFVTDQNAEHAVAVAFVHTARMCYNMH